ncbi:MAG: hypothetical protein Q8P24_00760 [Desulfobacterales bacterium]|nr:hypothetical protein [Desulfobacterales bacterium]
MRNSKSQFLHVSGALICVMFLGLSAGRAFSREPFYKGKTIAMIHSGQPGGTGDMRMRSVMPYLKKYIPGNPTLVAAYMPGAGGRKGANHIYSARPDGLTIAQVGAGLVANALLGEAGVMYDINKLIYLGMPVSSPPYVFFTKKDLGLDSLEKLKNYPELRVGSQAVGHPIYFYGRVFAWFLDLKNPRFVTGYSGPELDIAITQGEVDGRPNNASTFLQRNREWADKELVNFHAIIELPKGHKHPYFSNLPDLGTFARSTKETRVLDLQRAFASIGHSLLLPPGTPGELVKILRDAVTQTFKDPNWAADFQRLTGAEPTPLFGEQLEAAIKEVPREPEIIELYKKFGALGPLPPR